MKLKYLLYPYALIIVIFPALIAHMAIPLGLNQTQSEAVMDILMSVTAAVGLAAVIIRQKKSFRGWIPLLLLIVLVLIPQTILWKMQGGRRLSGLRPVYRFALTYITLFVIPLGIHLSGKETRVLIGLFCLYGVFCCLYQFTHSSGILQFETGIGSFFENPNRFGAYLALWLILCVFAIQLAGSKLWLFPAAFFACFLFFSKSRASLMLAGFFLIACMLSYRERIGTKNLLMILLDIAIVFTLLWLFYPTRNYFQNLIALDTGVSGRDRIWAASWQYFREANPLLGHGLGVQIEKIMALRLGQAVSTHNVYLYILNSGGVLLALFYILVFAFLLRLHCHRKHYLIPLLFGVLCYGNFELACAPFDYWHLSNMFTICLFFLPAASGIKHPGRKLPVH